MFIYRLYYPYNKMNKVMIAVHEQTKYDFRSLTWPSYITTDEARIRFIIEMFSKLR